MKTAWKKRGRTWCLIALTSLGLHYLMLMIASVHTSGGISFAQILEPKLTTLCQDTRAIGRIAAEKLIDASTTGLAAPRKADSKKKKK